MNIDLTNCEDEPIRIPGRIQGHGMLLVLSSDYRISHCSQNLAEFIGKTPSALLGQPAAVVDEFIVDRDQDGLLEQLVRLGKNKGFGPVNPYPVTFNGSAFNLLFNSSGNYHLVEFEPAGTGTSLDLRQVVGQSLSEMLSDKSLATLLTNTAKEVRRIIHFDRVMVYKFHGDGHGEVVAEAKNEELETWLGLHYPASDIPKQARDLYKTNLVRLIANVHDETVPIITLPALQSAPLDLTNAALRAVSPIHIQYLKNMGVGSSFSISLISNQELWGLIACHNYSPRFIDYNDRESAKLVGQVLSSALSFRQDDSDLQKTADMREAVDSLVKNLNRNNTVESALFSYGSSILDAVEASGAALIFDNHVVTAGDTPPEEFIKEIGNWLNEHVVENLYYSTRFPEEFAKAGAYQSNMCGLLAARLSRELTEYIIWFRPEVIQTVKWAGNPDKPVELTESGLQQISPRKSFETWSQQVRNSALPWEKNSIDSARRLQEEINYAVARKATELRILNEKLREAYEELDAFSYTISHDLKNPLTAIKGYSQLLTRNFELDPNVAQIVGRISAGANKMQDMIQTVLGYSRIGQSQPRYQRLQMENLLNELKTDLELTARDSNLVIRVLNTPSVYGDPTMISQVFANLLGNAVKYSAKAECPLVTVDGNQVEKRVVYSVADNGIGIAADEQDQVFDLFTRASSASDYEGTGVGLAIVKKIIEKHQGNIWLESAPGKGTTFYIAFPVEAVTVEPPGALSPFPAN